VLLRAVKFVTGKERERRVEREGEREKERERDKGHLD
jgi:hypothetical protein